MGRCNQNRYLAMSTLQVHRYLSKVLVSLCGSYVEYGKKKKMLVRRTARIWCEGWWWYTLKLLHWGVGLRP